MWSCRYVTANNCQPCCLLTSLLALSTVCKFAVCSNSCFVGVHWRTRKRQVFFCRVWSQSLQRGLISHRLLNAHVTLSLGGDLAAAAVSVCVGASVSRTTWCITARVARIPAYPWSPLLRRKNYLLMNAINSGLGVTIFRFKGKCLRENKLWQKTGTCKVRTEIDNRLQSVVAVASWCKKSWTLNVFPIYYYILPVVRSDADRLSQRPVGAVVRPGAQLALQGWLRVSRDTEADTCNITAWWTRCRRVVWCWRQSAVASSKTDDRCA